jgi:hypothetical protein
MPRLLDALVPVPAKAPQHHQTAPPNDEEAIWHDSPNASSHRTPQGPIADIGANSQRWATHVPTVDPCPVRALPARPPPVPLTDSSRTSGLGGGPVDVVPRQYAHSMRRGEPTQLEALARAAGLLSLHDAERDLLRLDDERSIDALMTAASAAHVRIVAIEGFELQAGQRRPDIGAIVDLSGCADAAESLVEARAALAELRERGLWFEFDLVA